MWQDNCSYFFCFQSMSILFGHGHSLVFFVSPRAKDSLSWLISELSDGWTSFPLSHILHPRFWSLFTHWSSVVFLEELLSRSLPVCQLKFLKNCYISWINVRIHDFNKRQYSMKSCIIYLHLWLQIYKLLITLRWENA